MQKEAFPSVYSVELQYAGKLTMTAAIDQGPTMNKALWYAFDIVTWIV